MTTRRRKIWICCGVPIGMVLLLTAFILLSPKPPLLQNTPYSTAYYDREGTLLRLSLASDDGYRIYTPLSQISGELITATLTQEDRYFYSHPGINPWSLLRGVMETYILRSRAMGGSTISMQVVRLRDQLDTRRVSGKLLQMLRALILERHYSKDEILEAYLNLAPYGGNIYGVGAASLIYFKQPARDLALPQSLALAVIPQNPVKRFPLNKDVSNWNLARQRLFDQLDNPPPEYAAFSRMDLPVFTREDLPFLAPHLIDGLAGSHTQTSVTTTLDLPTQRAFEQQVSAYLAHSKMLGFENAAAFLLHYPTMEARAVVGSADFFNAKIMGQVDGTLARRSPGSTLKPFIYALAMEQGLIYPGSQLDDHKLFFAEYRPGNFDQQFIGALSAKDALVLSRNVPAIAMAQQLKSPNLYDFLQSAGANFPRDRSHYGLSIAVGGAEIDMRTLVKFYAMLANGGVLKDIRYTDGNVPKPARRLLSPEASLLTLTMLNRPLQQDLPFTATSNTLPIYWKTGTSNGFRDAWTVGVFGPYVMAVWLGNFDGHANPALIGTDAAAPLFFDLVQTLAQKEPLQDRLGTELANLNVIKIAGESEESWFIPGKSPFKTAAPFATAQPKILSPRSGISYVYHDDDQEPLRIPLQAEGQTGTLNWFADNDYIGTAKDGQDLFWSPQPGLYHIRAVGPQGQVDSRQISVIVSN